MNQEQDQEKLLHAANIAFSNTLNGTLNLISSGKPKTTIEVTAADDLQDTRKSLKKGENISKIQEKLQNSPVAKRIEQKGGDILKYARSIIRKADLDNIVEPHANTSTEQAQDNNLDRGLER